MSTDLASRQQAAAERITAAGIFLRPDEPDQIEIADFGLGRFEEIGLAIHVYMNTYRCCGKELAMVPGQICPQHLHPDIDGEPGKEETFRVRAGEVHLFVPGDDSEEAKAFAMSIVPEDKQKTFTIYKHHHLKTGDQLTLEPNTPHWFAAGKDGAVITEFSTRSRDEYDIFVDKAIVRHNDESPHAG